MCEFSFFITTLIALSLISVASQASSQQVDLKCQGEQRDKHGTIVSKTELAINQDLRENN